MVNFKDMIQFVSFIFKAVFMYYLLMYHTQVEKEVTRCTEKDQNVYQIDYLLVSTFDFLCNTFIHIAVPKISHLVFSGDV